MAASVVFVHGTGVRGDRYQAQFERVRSGIKERRPDVVVLPCRWGERLGAALHSNGASLPALGQKANGLSDEQRAQQDWQRSQWTLLEIDPLHELRLIAASGRGRRFTIGAEPTWLVLADRMRDLPIVAPVRDELDGLGLLDDFKRAVPAVLESAAGQEALRLGMMPELAQAFGRALIAEALRSAAAGPVPVVEARRERLLLLVVEQLGGADLGVASALAKTAAVLAWRWAGAGALERRRAVLTDAAHPMPGDVLLYLSRGERIRRFIRDCCRDAPQPVVLLAHSLGGIACLDLLAAEGVAGVVRLVTVGSQAPFLYEIDALPSLTYGEPLPANMPDWTNIYDPRDLLAYVGEPLFPGRVTDIPIPSGNPFPFAHSDYFGNPVFYDRLGELLP